MVTECSEHEGQWCVSNLVCDDVVSWVIAEGSIRVAPRNKNEKWSISNRVETGFEQTDSQSHPFFLRSASIKATAAGQKKRASSPKSSFSIYFWGRQARSKSPLMSIENITKVIVARLNRPSVFTSLVASAAYSSESPILTCLRSLVNCALTALVRLLVVRL